MTVNLLEQINELERTKIYDDQDRGYNKALSHIREILAKEENKLVTYEVTIATYRESHQTTHHVLCKRSDRPNTDKFDHTGIFDVSHHTNREHAEIEQESWSQFLSGFHPVSHATLVAGWEEFRQLRDIKAIIRDLHLAYDNREHGDVAAHAALMRMGKVLDMPWVTGREKERRAQEKKSD